MRLRRWGRLGWIRVSWGRLGQVGLRQVRAGWCQCRSGWEVRLDQVEVG